MAGRTSRGLCYDTVFGTIHYILGGSSVQSANVCEEMYYKLHRGKDVLDEPAPVSGRGVRSEQGKGGVEHGKNRAHTREGDARLRAGWEE